MALLLADMLNIIIREAIFLSGMGPTGLITLILYIILTVVTYVTYIIISMVYLQHYRKELRKDHQEKEGSHHLYLKIILLAVETLGAVLNFYGDNISFILQHYGGEKELKCDQQCVENVRISAVITLGLALICHLFTPGLRRLTKILEYKTKIKGAHSAFDMITVFAKVDTVFTAVVIMAQTDDFCSTTEKAISRGFLTLCVLVGVGLMCFYCFLSMIKFYRDADGFKGKCSYLVVLLVLLIICFPIYLLADNFQPLDCDWGCDSFVTNGTLGALGCDAVGISRLRLGFSTATFLVVALIFTPTILILFRLTTEEENKEENESNENRERMELDQ